MNKPVPASSSSDKDKPLSRAAWWVLFLVATFVMSLWFQTFRAFTVTPSITTGLQWLAAMAGLILLMIVLIYDSYVAERVRGRLQRRIRLFEWLISSRFLLKKDLPAYEP